MNTLRIGLIGDRDDSVLAHRMIPVALELAAATMRIPVEPVWIGTDTIDRPSRVSEFDALWCVPASPYRTARRGAAARSGAGARGGRGTLTNA